MSKKYEIQMELFSRPSTNREELAWAAGFFDGEGTFSAVPNGKGKNGRQIVACVPQAGEYATSLLERFRQAVGCGSIYEVKAARKQPHWKPIFSWRTGKFSAVKQVMDCLWPWLGPAKRHQAERTLKLYDSRSHRVPMTTERGKDMANKRWRNAEEIHRN